MDPRGILSAPDPECTVWV